MNKDYKKQVEKMNAEFRDEELQQLEKNLPHILETLEELHESYESSNAIQKYILIHQHIYELSFYDLNCVKDILIKYKLNEILPKLFVDTRILLDKLYTHERISNHIFSLKEIYLLYKEYSKLTVKRQLALQLGIDIVKVAEKMNRQYKNNNSPELLIELTEESLKIKEILNSEGVKFNFKENTPFTSFTHGFNFPHKVIFRNLYDILLEINKEHSYIKNESDFKVEFYNLLDIILRDKTILKDEEIAQINYYNYRSFKTKRIESLLFR